MVPGRSSQRNSASNVGSIGSAVRETWPGIPVTTVAESGSGRHPLSGSATWHPRETHHAQDRVRTAGPAPVGIGSPRPGRPHVNQRPAAGRDLHRPRGRCRPGHQYRAGLRACAGRADPGQAARPPLGDPPRTVPRLAQRPTRKHLMAHITPTPAGSWRANWRDPTGRQRAKTFATKRDAKRFLADLETSLTRGLYVDPHASRVQLAPYAQRWLDSRNDEITTRARDASIMRTHVVTRWGTWPLGTIDHTGVQQWVSDLAAQLSPATVAEAHRLLSAVLRAAVRDRLLAVDPCEGIKVPRRRKRDTADQIIDRDTVRHHLLTAVPDRYRALVATAAGTGMRWGELAGLCDDALDPQRRTIRVIRTVVEVSGNTSFKPYPKSAAGRRSIPIPAWLRPTLLAHLDQYPPGQHGLVFANQ